jgi:hypothetical protein
MLPLVSLLLRFREVIFIKIPKIYITQWEEKIHLSHLPMHHGNALFNVNRYLNEIEDILREAGMEGLGYQDQEKEIEELIEDQANLNAYIYSAGWEFQEKIDTPLYKGFQNDAAEKLSRINLEDYTTENTLEIKKHHVMYDSYGNRLEYDTIAPSLSMADFLGISSLGTGSADGKLVGIPEEFKDFTSMFTMEYDSIKENLKDKDGNPISLEEYLNELHTYGEFDNKMDKPFLEFVSCILDVTILKPLIEMCWGYDLITGEDLSDFERGMKGVFAVIDVVSLMIGIKASGVVKIFSKNTLKMAGKSVLLDAFGGAGAYGIGQIGQELGLPLPITLLMSMGAGIGIVKVGGRYLFKDQAGNVLLDVAVQDVDALRKGVSGASAFGEMSVEEAQRYSLWNQLREQGLDQKAINDIILTNKPLRPAANNYLSSDYINNHLSDFQNGVTKIGYQAPTGVAGPPGGTYVMPSSYADDLILQANGDILKLEQLLGLDAGSLGNSPVRIDIPNPTGLRLPFGNELGANEFWIPGGFTSGGVIEAVIDSPLPSQYTVNLIK